MTKAFFLSWVADRIVHVYGESEHVDFVTKLRGIAAGERAGDSKAITALTRMVKAFGSGVSAANTAQAGSLAEAYACIEADLLAKRPEAEPVHVAKPDVEPVPAVQIFGWPEAGGTLADYVAKNKGAAVRVTFTDENVGAESGTLGSVGSTYFWLVEDQKSDFTRYRDSINFADVESIARDRKAEPIPAQLRVATPIVWDNEPVKADRSVGDVAKDWPGGRVTLADYVERNNGNRVRIEFEDNSELDRVGTIERSGSIMYFWVLDDRAEHGGRFLVAFCDVHTITRIPNRAVNPAAWPTFPGPTIKEFLADKLGKFVKITLKNGNLHAGTVEQGGSIDYFWLKNSAHTQSVYFDDVKYIAVLTERRQPFPATTHPYTKEEPAVLPDSWEKDDAARAVVDEIEKCARASIGVRVTIKFSDEKAGSVIGTICTVTHHGYVCFEEDGASGTCRLNEVESIEPIAVTDSWPGGDVSLNSYLNARVGQMITVDYGTRPNVKGEVFRNPRRPGQYRLLLRTGAAELFISDVVSVSCDK